MGDFGWHSGSIKARNLQSGSGNITVDGSGDGTQAIVFPKKFRTVPVVVLTQQEEDITGTVGAESVTVTGFTARADGSAVTSDSLTVGYIAMANYNL